MLESVNVRPSIALFERTAPDWKAVATENDTAYSFGYVMGMRDKAAGFEALALASVIPAASDMDYCEGYRDGYSES
jgi:hypothetical protein